LTIVEFLVPRRPVSLQAKNKANRRAWQQTVASHAAAVWAPRPPLAAGDLRLTIVYLCGDAPADIDNIIKPIQDALVGVVYTDDSLVTDVDSHRRPYVGTFDPLALPALVLSGAFMQTECIYVRVEHAQPLEALL